MSVQRRWKCRRPRVAVNQGRRQVWAPWLPHFEPVPRARGKELTEGKWHPRAESTFNQTQELLFI